MEKTTPKFADGVNTGVLIGTPLILYVLVLAIRRFFQGPTKGSDNKKRLDNKVVVITGCNAGIGKVTAHELSKKGARIIMLCRSLERAEAAAQEIRNDTGNTVDTMKLDLSSLESVRSCAKEILEKEEKIDILINNAGIMFCPEMRTKEGFEMQIGTNHFGHFLLTELLLPKLRKSAATGFSTRIVILSSMAHAKGVISWDDINLNIKGSYDAIDAYCQSKLANIMHGAALARRLKDAGITVCSLHPGIINTELYNHFQKSNPYLHMILSPFVNFFMKTTLHGAQTTLYCCLEDKVSAQSGKYFSDCAVKKPIASALVEKDQERLWKISCDLVGLKD